MAPIFWLTLNVGVVQTGIVDGNTGGILNLEWLSGANEGHGHSDKEGKHEKGKGLHGPRRMGRCEEWAVNWMTVGKRPTKNYNKRFSTLQYKL